MLAAILSVLLLLFSSAAPLLSKTSASNAQPDSGTVQVAMKNVMYHFSAPTAVHIVQLQGELVPTKPGTIVVFDDRNSFRLDLASAEIALTCDSLAGIMNDHVFSAQNAPIKSVSITNKNNQLIIKGRLHQKGDVPFETAGTLLVEPDGRIRFHAEHVKAAHVPVKGLLDLLGIDLARLIDTKKVQGISIDKDDLILNPEEVFPPPHIRGKVSSVRLQGNEIVLVFGTRQPSNLAARQQGNYMAYRNNDLRFGKLTMHDADMILIDMDPQDPFDFYLDHYKDQLVAGYSKTTPTFGLQVYMRDYNKLRKHAARAGN